MRKIPTFLGVKKVKKKYKKRTDGIGSRQEIINFIKDINASIVSLSEMNSIKDIDDRYVGLRHDVDYDLEHAIKLARLEYKNNISATYYLLHSAEYFDIDNQYFVDQCKILVDLGHSIGFHNNLLVFYSETKTDIKFYVEKIMNTLKSNSIDLLSTSSHGDKLCYEKQILNYEIWEEFDDNKYEGLNHNDIQFPKFKLKDFGFDFEAYFCNFDFYLSDSGGKSIGYDARYRKIMFEKTASESPDNIGINVLEKFYNLDKAKLQLLIHPIWWK